MSGLDGLGWPNPEDEPKPKTMNDTPETDKCVKQNKHLKFLQEYVWVNDNKITYENPIVFLCQKLERERDEAIEQRDAVTLRLGNTQERMFDAEMQRDRLIKSVEPLKYWRDISECDCSNPLPQGGCLRCNLNRILKTTNPNEL
jgi:hypothetical protein